MPSPELKFLKFLTIISLSMTSFMLVTACTIQWAFHNKNCDTGFTNDRLDPGAHKDPMTFYGPSRQEAQPIMPPPGAP